MQQQQRKERDSIPRAAFEFFVLEERTNRPVRIQAVVKHVMGRCTKNTRIVFTKRISSVRIYIEERGAGVLCAIKNHDREITHLMVASNGTEAAQREMEQRVVAEEGWGRKRRAEGFVRSLTRFVQNVRRHHLIPERMVKGITAGEKPALLSGPRKSEGKKEEKE